MAEDPIIDSMFSIMLKAIFFTAALFVAAPTLQRVLAATPWAQSLAAQSFVGATDYRELDATDHLQWLTLTTPWITASFFNDGDPTNPLKPISAYVAINSPDAFTELKQGESSYANFSFAQQRIQVIFYKTTPGNRARVRVEGKY